jgi:hypothetical protein
MSFGLGISFGRFCKCLKITGYRFFIIRASGKIYDSYEEIRYKDKIWYITPDGQFHDDIEIEDEENVIMHTPSGIMGYNKKVLEIDIRR